MRIKSQLSYNQFQIKKERRINIVKQHAMHKKFLETGKFF